MPFCVTWVLVFWPRGHHADRPRWPPVSGGEVTPHTGLARHRGQGRVGGVETRAPGPRHHLADIIHKRGPGYPLTLLAVLCRVYLEEVIWNTSSSEHIMTSICHSPDRLLHRTANWSETIMKGGLQVVHNITYVTYYSPRLFLRISCLSSSSSQLREAARRLLLRLTSPGPGSGLSRSRPRMKLM